MGRCLFPTSVVIFAFEDNKIEVLFPTLSLDSVRKRLCLPPRKGMNRLNENTFLMILITVSSALNVPLLTTCFFIQITIISQVD